MTPDNETNSNGEDHPSAERLQEADILLRQLKHAGILPNKKRKKQKKKRQPASQNTDIEIFISGANITIIQSPPSHSTPPSRTSRRTQDNDYYAESIDDDYYAENIDDDYYAESIDDDYYGETRNYRYKKIARKNPNTVAIQIRNGQIKVETGSQAHKTASRARRNHNS